MQAHRGTCLSRHGAPQPSERLPCRRPTLPSHPAYCEARGFGTREISSGFVGSQTLWFGRRRARTCAARPQALDWAGRAGPGHGGLGWARRESSELGRTGLQPGFGPPPRPAPSRGEKPFRTTDPPQKLRRGRRRACARGGAEAAHAPYGPPAPKPRPRWRRPRRGREVEGARGAVSGLPRAGNGPSAAGASASAGLASCQANGSNCRLSLLLLTLPLGRPLPPVPATVRLPLFPRPAPFVWLPPPQPLAGGRAGGAVSLSTPLSLPPRGDWSFPPRELPAPVPAAPAAGHPPPGLLLVKLRGGRSVGRFWFF